jgi:hypothetical protein
MIGIWQNYSGEYLLVVAIGTVIIFGMPMLIAPLRWAQVLRWQLPRETDLAVYFGRCLGGVICLLAYGALRAARAPLYQSFYFELILGCFVMMILIHIYGAIKQIQPLSETLEIAYWLGLFIITLCFYPGS